MEFKPDYEAVTKFIAEHYNDDIALIFRPGPGFFNNLCMEIKMIYIPHDYSKNGKPNNTKIVSRLVEFREVNNGIFNFGAYLNDMYQCLNVWEEEDKCDS